VIELFNLLKIARFPHSTEVEMQEAIAAFLKEKGFSFSKEHSFDAKNRVDFFIDGIAVECKVGGQPVRIHRQLERYAKFPEVKGIILMTSKYMKVQEKINDKPAMVIHVGRSWL